MSQSKTPLGGGLSLRDWLVERKANCERIAQTKRGTDRYGWLEDSQYFHDAISALDRLQAERELFARHVKERASELTRLSAEKAEVERERDDYRSDYLRRHKDVGVWMNRAVEAESALLQAREDAQRYRWLHANHLQTGPDSWIRTGDDLEEAIDAARQAEPQEGEKE